MYLGPSPFDAPATYSLVQYTELADGVWLPVGGIYRVIESLVRIAEAHGVRFLFNAPVKQIIVDGNRATGVELTGRLVVSSRCDRGQRGSAIRLLPVAPRRGGSPAPTAPALYLLDHHVLLGG